MKINKKKSTAISFSREQLILGTISLLIFGLVVGIILVEGSPQKKRVTAIARSTFSTHTMEIAKDFRCPCGTCGEKNLALCVCETALSEKNYIEKSLNAGRSHEQVAADVERIYGLRNGG